MALGAIAIASLVASGLKGLAGLGQGLSGRKQQKDLWKNRPLLGVTEGEKENDNLYKQMASATEMPGQKRVEENLGQAYAEGVSDIQKTSQSGLMATQGAIDLSGKKMQAIQDLAGQFAEYKAQRQDALAGWNNQKSQMEQQRFQVNEYEPWNIKMNEAVGRKQAGWQSFGQGMDQGLGMLGDLQGTQQYIEMVKSMYPNLGIGGQGGRMDNQSNTNFTPTAPDPFSLKKKTYSL